MWHGHTTIYGVADVFDRVNSVLEDSSTEVLASSQVH